MALENKNDVFENSNFDTLPKEILVEILKNVSIEDMTNFCDAYTISHEYLFHEKTLIRKMDLSHYFEVDFEWLETKINPEYVTSLNINDCHWISAVQLRKFIGKLVNLKQLSALRTELCFCQVDAEIYNQKKIEKIALTLSITSEGLLEETILPSITTLCLELFSIRGFPMDCLKFPNLEKVLIESYDYSDLIRITNRFNADYNSAKLMRKVVISSKTGSFGVDLSLTQLQNYYNGHKYCQPEITCFEVFEAVRNNNGTEVIAPRAWQLLQSLGKEEPIRTKRCSSKKLYSGEETLDSIQFEELNFHHGPICTLSLRVAYKEILKLPNVRRVKRIALCNCLLKDFNENSDQFKEITHIELYNCPDLRLLDPKEYNLIAKFAQLRYLYVEILRDNDGHFLIPVLKHCIQLETLWINSYDNPNDIINNQLHEALEFCAKLKELTIEKYRLSINDVLKLLLGAKNVKLRKLRLMSRATDKLNLDLLSEFVRANSQLTHCLLNSWNFTQEEQNYINQNVTTSKPNGIVICHNPQNGQSVDCSCLWDFKSVVCCVGLEDFQSF